jgi:hypothetical protein
LKFHIGDASQSIGGVWLTARGSAGVG